MNKPARSEVVIRAYIHLWSEGLSKLQHILTSFPAFSEEVMVETDKYVGKEAERIADFLVARGYAVPDEEL